MTTDQQEQTQQGQQGSSYQGSSQGSQQGQSSGQQQGSVFGEQSSYDFLSQHPSFSGSSGVQDAWTAYWELAEATLRTARRVSEVQILSLMRQEIVREVSSSVINEIRRNPQMIKQALGGSGG
jgi:flagellar biosynthesis/type III secretory pathway protein FliH